MKLLLTSMMGILRPYWISVVFVFFAIAVQMSFRLAMPFGYQLAFDDAIPARNGQYLWQIVGVLAAWWLIQSALSVAQDARAAAIGVAAINDLRARMYRGLMQLPMDGGAKNRSGDLVSRFTSDLTSLETTAVNGIYVFYFSCFNALASLVLLCFFEWRLAMLTLAGLILSTIAPRYLTGKAEQQSYQRKNDEGELSGFVQETLGTIDVVHAFNLKTAKTREFETKLKAFKAKATSAHFLSAMVGRLGGQSASLLQVLILAFGAFFVISGDMTLGTLVGFLALLQNMMAAMSHLSGVLPSLLQATGANRRVQEFLSEVEESTSSEAGQQLPRLRETFSFQEVSFAYGRGPWVLNRLSFAIGFGQSVAIVGPNGSGKSTLLKLLLRFYEPGKGALHWDGEDVRHYSRESLRDQVSIVPQEPVLFSESLRENIRMGRLDASDEDIIAAAKQAELHDFIRSLPKGYDTPAGEWGHHLSGGLRQRVAIARAILRDPVLLILDEATSALDPLTAKAIQKTLQKVARNRTLLSVTHHLETVTKMDQIIVMQHGRVAQQGTHQFLLDQRGPYADLWRKQSGFTLSGDGSRAECEPDRLKLVPLFQDLDLPRLKKISQSLFSEYVHKDRPLFRRGDAGDKFYIIVRGQVAISQIEGEPNPEAMTVLESGDFFGELALLDGTSRNASATTLTPSLLLTLSKHDFQTLMAEIPELQQAIEQVARERRIVH